MGVPVLGNNLFGAQGNSYFVDPYAGNDANSGKTVAAAKKSVKAAYDLCADGKNDVVYLLSNGSSGAGTADVLTAAITWSKHRTHLIGVCAPQLCGQRARINTTTLMTPMFTLSGRGCYIANIQFSNNGTHATTAAVCMYVSGDNSSFENCQFQGLGALAVVDNSHRSLVIASADDCYFKNCTIGSDTMDYGTAANSVLEFIASGEASRNVFDGCLFLGGGSANAFFVSSGSQGTASVTLFKDCTFYNNDNGTMDAMNYGMSVTGAGGVLVLQNSFMVGASEVANDPGNIYGCNTYPTAADAGKAIVITKA
jgi:hypothetical protein